MAGETYAKRYAGGFIDLPNTSTPVDSAFLNAVETALLRLLGEDPAADEVGVWVPASNRFVFQKITNANIDAAAAIDKSKLGALNIVNADVAATAAIAKSKLAALNIVDADVSAISLSKIAANASVGTSLPGSPTNGQVVVLTDSLTTPSYAWTFVYLSGISDAYKWLLLGGSAREENGVAGTTTTSSRSLVGTGLTLDRAGIYRLEIGGNLKQPGGDFVHAVLDATNGTVTTRPARHNRDAADNEGLLGVSMVDSLTVASAATVMRLGIYNSNGVSTVTLEDGYLRALPVRVA